MKTTVVYHSADYDGIFCREIARKFLPDAELIGWNFGDTRIPMPEGQVSILDLSPDCISGIEGLGQTACIDEHDFLKRIIWIDHHKTSIEKWPESIQGYRIDGVAACRLAWQWFATGNVERNPMMQHDWKLPEKQDFIDRKVSEPLAVRLAGEYDIWDKRDPDADMLQYGLRCQNGDLDWNALLDLKPGRYLESLLEGGRWAQRYAQSIDADLVKYRSYRLQWEGLDFLVLNTGRFNSLTFAALDVPETGHDALMGYMFNGKCWTVSLYHAKNRTDIDLSEIAKKYGGGGHRGACGFTCDKLPFHP